MNDPGHRWEDPDDEPREPSRIANWHRLPYWALWVLISLALFALVLMGLALAAGMAMIP